MEDEIRKNIYATLLGMIYYFAGSFAFLYFEMTTELVAISIVAIVLAHTSFSQTSYVDKEFGTSKAKIMIIFVFSLGWFAYSFVDILINKNQSDQIFYLMLTAVIGILVGLYFIIWKSIKDY